MSISDWSSDVCSSDLWSCSSRARSAATSRQARSPSPQTRGSAATSSAAGVTRKHRSPTARPTRRNANSFREQRPPGHGRCHAHLPALQDDDPRKLERLSVVQALPALRFSGRAAVEEIGRASCRESGWQAVYISGVDVEIKKKKKQS